MKMTPTAAFALALLLSPVSSAAQEHGGSHEASPYAGLQSRAIAVLSEDDVAELRRGGGWGLALPAEMNGAPGPTHLLELKEELGLPPDQVAAIEAIVAAMRGEAVAAGERLIAAEAALDDAFAAGNLENVRLRALTDDAEAARADLRFVHLSRHLATPALLTADQVTRYQILRGYASE